eukprot:scpid18587/ scgid2605/ Uncharacterized protein C7orf63 homolog
MAEAINDMLHSPLPGGDAEATSTPERALQLPQTPFLQPVTPDGASCSSREQEAVAEISAVADDDEEFDLTPRSLEAAQERFPSMAHREGVGCRADDWWNYAPTRPLQGRPTHTSPLFEQQRVDTEDIHFRSVLAVQADNERAVRSALGTEDSELVDSRLQDYRTDSEQTVSANDDHRERETFDRTALGIPQSAGESTGDYGESTDGSRLSGNDGESTSTSIADETPRPLFPYQDNLWGGKNPCRPEFVEIHHRLPSYLWQQRRAYKASISQRAGDNWKDGWDEAEGSFMLALQLLSELDLESPEDAQTVASVIMTCCLQQDDLFGGFLLEHVYRLRYMLERIKPHLGKCKEYHDPALTIFSMLQKPLLALNVKECAEFSYGLVQLINTAAGFLSCGEDTIMLAITLLLCKWATAAGWPSTHDAVRDLYLYQPAPYPLHEAAMETSYATLLLMDTWDPCSPSKPNVFIRETLVILADKDMCRQQIACSDRVKDLIPALASFEPDTREYQEVLSLISRLLMYEDDEIKAVGMFATRESLQLLRLELERTVVPKSVKFLLSMRNELVHIILMIASLCPSAPFVSSGLLEDLCLLATFTEVKSNRPLVHKLEFREYHDDDDFLHADVTLKGTLMMLMSVVNTTPAVIDVMKHQFVMTSLLFYVADKPLPSFPFSPGNFVQLQLYAMTALLHIAPKMLPSFIEEQGANRLVMLLEHLCSERCFIAEDANGTLIRAALSCEQQMSLLEATFQILYALIRQDDEQGAFRSDLIAQGAVHQVRTFVVEVLTKVFIRRMSRTGIHEADVSARLHSAVHLATQLLNLLHCDTHPQYDANDAASFDYLKVMLEMMSGAKEGVWVDVRTADEAIPIAVLESIQRNVVNNAACEERVFALGLVRQLLDILNMSHPGNFQDTLITVLSDLADNGEQIPQFKTWTARRKRRSSTDKSPGNGRKSTAEKERPANVFTMMARLWREAEERAEVTRGTSGEILDCKAPLLTKDEITTRRAGQQPDRPATSYDLISHIRHYPSVQEVDKTQRPAIANIVHKAGPVPGHVGGKDRVTMTTIHIYLDMKCMEVIQDTIDDLDRRSIPVPDMWMQWLDECLVYAAKRARAATELQMHYANADTERELSEEAQYFQERLGWNKLEKLVEDEKEKQRLLTSNLAALKAASGRRRELAAEARRRNPRPTDGVFHDVTLPNLRTKYTGGQVAIEATPSILLSIRESANTEARHRLEKTVTHFRNDREYQATLDLAAAPRQRTP